MAQTPQSATPRQLWLAIKAKLTAECAGLAATGRVRLVIGESAPRVPMALYSGDGFLVTCRFADWPAAQEGSQRQGGTILDGRLFVWVYSRSFAGAAKDDELLLTDLAVGLYELGQQVVECLDMKYLYDATDATRDLLVEPMRLGTLSEADRVKENKQDDGQWPIVFNYRTAAPTAFNVLPG